MPRSHFTVEKAKERALLNIADMEPMMRWNAEHGIFVFRLSSDVFPHFTDLETESYTIDFARPLLKRMGEIARECGQRITMHPGQFNQVGAKSRSVFDSTVADLSHHADILDAMDLDSSSILCIHGGGTYGDKENTMRRWVDQFHEMPEKVRRRLAIEPCERAYSLEDIMELSYHTRCPVIFDTHHDACYRQLHPEYQPEDVADQLPSVIETWDDRIPMMHISEQRPNARIGAHSDRVEKIPEYLLDLRDRGVSIDIDLECKDKEGGILQLYDTYPKVFN